MVTQPFVHADAETDDGVVGDVDGCGTEQDKG